MKQRTQLRLLSFKFCWWISFYKTFIQNLLLEKKIFFSTAELLFLQVWFSRSILNGSPHFSLLCPGSRSPPRARHRSCPLGPRPPLYLFPHRCAITSASSRTSPAALPPHSTALPGKRLKRFSFHCVLFIALALRAVNWQKFNCCEGVVMLRSLCDSLMTNILKVALFCISFCPNYIRMSLSWSVYTEFVAILMVQKLWGGLWGVVPGNTFQDWQVGQMRQERKRQLLFLRQLSQHGTGEV